ncbi:MAG: hypothetical protein KDA74_24515, partial [Planctomycetaceae bacterium]|nr:hypothetical protein [Planctomycetaceae bacterium]
MSPLRNCSLSLLKLSVFLLCTLIVSDSIHAAGTTPKQPLQIATFECDITPPIGSPLCYGHITPAKKIVDPLSARGIIFLNAGKPIVLLALDWVGANNGAQDVWKERLAEALGTTVDRCAVHCLHQHDTPGVDISANALLEQNGLKGVMYDAAYVEDVMQRTIAAAKQSLTHPQTVTHVGTGKAKV